MKKTIVYFLCFLSILIIAILLYPNKTESQAVEVIEVVEYRPSNIKVYAFSQVLEKWGEKEWASFSQIINKESKWEITTAHYPTSKISSAWGLCGTLVKTHQVEEGFHTDPYKQIDWCMDYISKRYKLPSKALEFHKRQGWF